MCVHGEPYNALQVAIIDNSSDYRELNCGVPNVNELTLQIATEFKPDIVFIQVQKDDIITENTVIELKKLGCFVVNYTGDVRSPIPQWYYDLGKHVDLTLFSNMNDVIEMRSQGYRAEYLEIGVNSEIYNPVGPVTKVKPIVFFGNNYGQKTFPLSDFRIQMVKFLKDKFPNDFGVYGNGWLDCDGNFNNSQEAEAAAYRGANIAISCSHFDYERYSSDRLLRILSTGTPICLAKAYPKMDQDWDNGIHLRTWNTLGDLEVLIQNYLQPSMEMERRIIVEKGMLHCMKNFTFDNMIKNLISLYNQYK